MQKKNSEKYGSRKPTQNHALLPLPAQELYAVLRAADDVIGEGGRTQVAKILKGSKEKQLLEKGLDQNPAYGFFHDLKLEQIMEKIDSLIDRRYIRREWIGKLKLPILEFTPLGWAVERERRAKEFLQEWDHWIEAGITPVSMEYLKGRNRGMLFLFLYMILCSGDKRYIPFLTQWANIDFKKVQAEIRQVISDLEQRDHMEVAEWQTLLVERIRSLIVRSEQPIFLDCQKCGHPFIFDEYDLSCYQSDGIQFTEICPRCEFAKEEREIKRSEKRGRKK